MRTYQQFLEYCVHERHGAFGLADLLAFLGGWRQAITLATNRQLDDELHLSFLTLASPAICAQLLLDAAARK